MRQKWQSPGFTNKPRHTLGTVAVREVVKEAFLHGDGSVSDELFRRSFQNVVPLSKTSPEQIDAIRAWGRERAVPASGQPIGGMPSQARTRRAVLV